MFSKITVKRFHFHQWILVRFRFRYKITGFHVSSKWEIYTISCAFFFPLRRYLFPRKIYRSSRIGFQSIYHLGTRIWLERQWNDKYWIDRFKSKVISEVFSRIVKNNEYKYFDIDFVCFSLTDTNDCRSYDTDNFDTDPESYIFSPYI